MATFVAPDISAASELPCQQRAPVRNIPAERFPGPDLSRDLTGPADGHADALGLTADGVRLPGDAFAARTLAEELW